MAPPEILNRDFSSRSDLLIAVQQAQTRIEERYHREGYLFAGFDSTSIELAVPVDSSQGYEVRFWLREGLQYRIRSIPITGVSSFGLSTIQDELRLKPGDILDEAALKEDITSILRRYAEHGLPFAKVSIASIAVDTLDGAGGLSISLNVDEGRPAHVSKIVIEGNTSTSRDVIVRELRIAPGSLYDPEEIERGRSRLERLGYFEVVEEPDLYLLSDTAVALVIRVKEANTSRIDGVLGYNPPKTASESGYISGLVELGFGNISGSGRDASLHYARENELSQDLEVSYLEPWLFSYPINLGLAYSQRQQDTSYTQSSIRGQLTFAMNEDLSLAVSLALDRVVPTDLPNYAFSAYDSRSLSTGLIGQFDTRDNRYAPRSGVLAVLGATYSQKSINGPARFIDSTTPVSQGLRTITLDAAAHHTLFSTRIVGVFAIHARSISTGSGLLDESDLFRVGGYNSIRGYREAELRASRFGYATSELRFMTGRLSFLFGFLEGGMLVRDSTKLNPSEQVQYPLSYGLGLQLESPLGLMSVSVALAKGEPFDQAKFHFGLVKQF
jgi:outer membrane protein assembly factor BamA